MTEITYRPATLDDTAAIADILNAQESGHNDPANYSVEMLRGDLESPQLDLTDSSLLAVTADGRIAGFEFVFSGDNRMRATAWGKVHPDWRDMGIGSALIEWAVQRASQHVGRVPADARVSVAIHVFHQDGKSIKLLEDRGFKYLRSTFVMRRDFDDSNVTDATLPDNYRLVSFAEFPDLRAFIDVQRDAFRDHWGWIETPIEDEMQSWQHLIDTGPDFDPNFWWLAFEGEQPAGVIMTMTESHFGNDVAWVGVLGVRRNYRKRGLASGLLKYAFNAHKDRGAKGIALSVDASSLSNAVALYERAGMVTVEQRDAYELELRPGEGLTKQ
jgi:mycothiol synthase